MPLTLTDTVRSFFAPGTAAFILGNIEQARTRIAPPAPDKAQEHLSRWYLGRDPSQLASRVFYDNDGSDPDQWLMLDIAVPVYPWNILRDVPEEHRTFIVRANKVWTLGDLAVHDDELYCGLDIILTPEAFGRIRANRLQIERGNRAGEGA